MRRRKTRKPQSDHPDAQQYEDILRANGLDVPHDLQQDYHGKLRGDKRKVSLEAHFIVDQDAGIAGDPADRLSEEDALGKHIERRVVVVSESERYSKIARALKIRSRIVRDTCQNLKRFLQSEAYADRLRVLQSGKSWMRGPELVRPVSFVASGRVGKRHGPFQRLPFIPCSPEAQGAEPFRVTLNFEAVEWRYGIAPYGREPHEFNFRGGPQEMANFQKRVHIIEDSFRAWLLQQRPKMRPPNLYRARQIALWYACEASGLRRLPADN